MLQYRTTETERQEIMNELYQLVGRLEQSAVDAKENVNRIDKRLEELDSRLDEVNTTLSNLAPILKEAAEHAADWRNTKKRGILYLAAAGASGIAGTLGFQKLGPFLFAIIK